MQVITLGPLSMDAPLLLSLMGIIAMFFTAGYLEKKRQVKIEGRLWLIVLLAVFVGRFSFVAQYWLQYQESWLAMLNVRDGGFHWQAALTVGIVALLWWVVRNPPVRAAALSSVAVGVVIFTLGMGAVQWMKPSTVVAMPKIELHNLQQQPVALEQYQGKPVVLNLWASWCPPCRREMPVLEAAQREHPEVHFVFANQAESAQTVEKYLQNEGLDLQNVLLDQHTAIAELVKSRGLPTTLFIDAAGNMQSYRMGELSAASLASHLSRLK